MYNPIRRLINAVRVRIIADRLLKNVVRPPSPLVLARVMEYKGDARFARGAIVWQKLLSWAEEDGKAGKCRACGFDDGIHTHTGVEATCWLAMLWEEANLNMMFDNKDESC